MIHGTNTIELSEAMIALLRDHFWCDFSDIIHELEWDEKKPSH
jgi:hypothetical protein